MNIYTAPSVTVVFWLSAVSDRAECCLRQTCVLRFFDDPTVLVVLLKPNARLAVLPTLRQRQFAAPERERWFVFWTCSPMPSCQALPAICAICAAPPHLRRNGVPPQFREGVASLTGARFPSSVNTIEPN